MNILIAKRVLQVLASILLQAAILFISSGRLDWIMVWVYVGVYMVIVAFNALLIMPKNPDLIAERAQLKENTKAWDRKIANILTTAWLATLFVAGLNFRFGWSPKVAVEIELAAFAFFILGNGLFSWAMVSNRFFARGVRIQRDRGHTVETGGPYRIIRHPGYLGAMTYSLATPLLLGSLWGLIPGVTTAGLFVVRTALEDHTLLEELEGYTQYARRVRYRLIPAVW
jgi:protein-S-isoprenylcysteine O-methyltransferase Ste14